tara:strand:+ start:1734 stop:2618 length:885 start_codon:yes stop_codon:yes gene_type:complete
MGGDDCNAAIQQNFAEAYPAFKDALKTGLQSTSLGNAQNSAAALNSYAQSMLDGTYYTNSNFDQDSWNLWKNQYYNSTRESFDNIKEPLDNINTIELINSATKVRHQALRSTNSFPSDCDYNVDNVMREFKTQETNDFDKLKSYMSSLITSYKHLFDYKSSIKAIYNEKLDRLANIQYKIDTYKQNLFMDERKNNYQSSNYDFYKSAHFFVLIIYFSLLALYLIFSDFIKEQRYKERKNIIGLISYIITPFLLSYILDNIYKIYIFVLEFNNIRDDVISYPYIVNKFNKTDDEI